MSNGSGTATSAEATLTVVEPTRRRPVITIPGAGTTYAGGRHDQLRGHARRIPRTGLPPASAYTWWVNFHHDTHFHPFLPPTSGITSGSFVVPVIGETSPNVWYRIHLSVVDSVGLTNEIFRDVLPEPRR